MADRDKVVVESSLVLLSHPEAVKKLNAAASEAKATLTGISDAAGQSVWTAGDAQSSMNETTIAFTTYTLEFSGPVPIANFHDKVMGQGLESSILHFRRPGDPIGRDYKVIQQMEDAVRTPAPAQKAAQQQAQEQPQEQPQPPPQKPIPYKKSSITLLKDPNDFTGSTFQGNKDTIQVIPLGNGTNEFYADFALIEPDGSLKMWRVRGASIEGVKNTVMKEYGKQFSNNLNSVRK